MPEIAELDIKVNTQSITKADAKLRNLGNTALWLEGILKRVFTAFLVYKIIEAASAAAVAAARYETLGIVMYNVGNNAGYTAKQMDEYDKALQKSGISMTESRNNLARMAQAQLDLSKSSAMARIAQDAAVIGNMNSSEAFSRMIYGIQSGQTEILRTIGLNVNFEASYKKLADQLGKNTKQLTEKEKMQARANAVEEKGAQIAGTYEAAMGTVGKQMTSLSRVLDNLQVKIGEVLKPALGAVIKSIYENVAKVNEWLDKHWELLMQIGVALGDVVSGFSDLISRLTSLDEGLETTDQSLTFVLRTLQGISGITAVLTDTITGLKVIFLQTAEAGARMWQMTLRGMIEFIGAIPDWLIPGGKDARVEAQTGLRVGIVNMEIAARYASQLADKTSMGQLATEKWMEGLDRINKTSSWKDKPTSGDSPVVPTVTSDADNKAKKELEAAQRHAQELYDLQYEARITNEKLNEEAYLQQEKDAQAAMAYAKEYWAERDAWEMSRAQKHANDMKNVNTQMFGELGKTLSDWASRSTDVFVEFVSGGKASFSDLIQSMIKDLLKMYVYKNIMGPIFGTDGDGSSGLSGMFNSLFGFASGGPVSAGVPIRVGERGEEVFVPSTNGRVVPNSQLGGGTNNIQINVNVTESGATTKGANQKGEDIGRSLKPYMDAWAMNEMRHGGVLNPA